MRLAKLGLRLNVSFHPVELDKRRCILDLGFDFDHFPRIPQLYSPYTSRDIKKQKLVL